MPFLAVPSNDKKWIQVGFEPKNPVLQACTHTPKSERIAGSYSKNVNIYRKQAFQVSGFRFHAFERAMVSCFLLHASCYGKYHSNGKYPVTNPNGLTYMFREWPYLHVSCF